MGMSRDSLNGTIAGTDFIRPNDVHHERFRPTSESNHTLPMTSTETDRKAENASIKIQQWYRKKRLERRIPTNQKSLTLSQQLRSTDYKLEERNSIDRKNLALFQRITAREDENDHQPQRLIISRQVEFSFVLLNFYLLNRTLADKCTMIMMD